MATHALYLVSSLRRLETEAARSLPPGTLMQRAADAAFQWIQTHHAEGAIALLCGPGNNGGDGWALANRLHEAGRTVHVFSVTPTQKLPDDARRQRERASADLPVHAACPAPGLPTFKLIVDALFGIGLDRELAAPYPAWIDWANSQTAQRLALDLPTGLDADTGSAQSATFQADATLSFLADKPGLHTLDGPDHAGRIVIDTLDVSPTLPADGEALSAQAMRLLLPARRRNSHKGSHGTLAVVGGQTGMEGAALLAARSALLSGSGKVFIGWAQPQSPSGLAVDPQHPELMLRPFHALLAQRESLGIGVWAVGCGLGMEDEIRTALLAVLDQSRHQALVLDADALNLLAREDDVPPALLDRPRPAILTPHPLEAARLLGWSVDKVQAGRIEAATALARRYRSVVVLKGVGTVVANPTGCWAINTSGNPGLASAGTGDVLCGLIGSLLAQGLDPWAAARAGVWLHGAAADLCVEEGAGPIGLCAGELPVAIRRLLNTQA